MGDRMTRIQALSSISLMVIVIWGQLVPSQAASTQVPQPPSSPSTKVEGQIVRKQGQYYVIKDSHGKEFYLLVSLDTELSGTFKPGDRVAVWTSPIEHAIAIRAIHSESAKEEFATATHVLKGELTGIEGNYYVILGPDGKELHVLVDEDTELTGRFEPGDRIEVFTSPLEHAIAIKAAD